MLMVCGLVLSALAAYFAWQAHEPEVSSVWFDIENGPTGLGLSGNTEKTSSEQSLGSNTAHDTPWIFIPNNLKRSGYMPDMVVVRDHASLNIQTPSVDHIDQHRPVASTDWAITELGNGNSPDLDGGFHVYDLSDYDDGLAAGQPFLPATRMSGHGSSGTTEISKGIVALAPFIWPRYMDTTTTGTVTLLVTIPKSKLRPKEYKVLYDDAGFQYAVTEMLDRSTIRPPLYNGERMTVTVEWTFRLCWRCKQFFVSENDLFDALAQNEP
ncbi:MAG: hypothetical protein JSW34_10295 [Candidatus Zixiibacteriota bacterium]|nr:MAG: hypothetical protein JSW34_10295 [candidate division Zixibacteria bacterium]